MTWIADRQANGATAPAERMTFPTEAAALAWAEGNATVQQRVVVWEFEDGEEVA